MPRPNIHPNNITIGKALRTARHVANLSLRDMATLTGMSISEVSLIERGMRNTSIARASEMADALGLTISISAISTD